MLESISPKLLLLCLPTFGAVHISHAQAPNPSVHTHGVAEMTVIYEAGEIVMELEAPAANLLGFEHAPQNEDEWLQVKNLHESMKAPENIATLTPSCDIRIVEVDMPFSKKRETKKHKEHHAHNHEQDTHNDIHINYAWHCKKQIPPSIHFHVFEHFSTFEKLNVQWISNGLQGAASLDKEAATLELKM